MRPKGFGKNYFTLTSILAHAVAPVLHSQISRVSAHLDLSYEADVELDEDPPDEELTTLPCLLNNKPCHCNYYFNHLTRLIFLTTKQLCTKNCNCRFYSFRRTGTHPPQHLYTF